MVKWKEKGDNTSSKGGDVQVVEKEPVTQSLRDKIVYIEDNHDGKASVLNN